MKAYWVARVAGITDKEQYQRYVDGTKAPFARFGAKPLARGGRYQVLEGMETERNVVVEFPDLESAVACYESEEYQEAKKHREGIADVHVVVVEGC